MAKGQHNSSETWHYPFPIPSAPWPSRGGHSNHAIETARARLDILQWRATRAPEGSEEVLSRALEELRTALEELQVADEELRQQNEDLARARQTAEAERRRYQELFDGAPYGYLLTDALAVIQEANRAAAALLAVPQEMLSGKPLVLFVAQDERRVFLAQLRRAAELEPVQDWEIRLQPRGRLPLYAALTVTAVHDPEARVVALRWLLRDISERKAAEAKAIHAEHALRDSREQLRSLTTHLQDRQEEERRRIAREVHDELGQGLTVLKIDLAWLANRLEANEPACRQRLQDMEGMLHTLVTAVHRIGRALRPEILDDLGLVAAIEWQLQEVCQRTGLAYELALPKQDLMLEPALATAMFRIFQEAITNVLRHAKATKVTVRMLQQPKILSLEISDNGKGLTPRQLNDRGSLGLLSMRERAHLWGGEVIIKGKRGRGTSIIVRMPYETSQAPEAEA